ncbi:MAG: class IV adenylate cyclase [Candidatus Aminicenantes bacterium]|nr:class IV adenylate cyclase [Candidatus Aminicenantes bacterium]
MRNVEIKARVRDLEDFSARLKALKPKKPRVLVQEDVFFFVPRGRLKLRILGPKSGELIYYDRPDLPGPKASDYELVRTAEPGKLRHVLTAAFGVRGIVKKVRMISLIGQTRVHLDEVGGLGLYMELEVVLEPGQTVAAGTAIARDLAKKLGIKTSDFVAGAYLDLLEKPFRRVRPAIKFPFSAPGR